MFGERIAYVDTGSRPVVVPVHRLADDLGVWQDTTVCVPTLVIWGRGDRLIPPADGALFQTAIRGARLVVLDRCGHEPQVECAARFDQALIRFIGEH